MEFPFSRVFGAGTHQLGVTDLNVIADTTLGIVNFILPSIASVIEASAKQGYGVGSLGSGNFAINITDIADASVNNIIVNADAADKLNGNVSSVTVNQKYGAVVLKPTSNNIWSFSNSSSSSSSSGLPFGTDTGVSNAYQVAIVGATLTDGYLCEVRITNTNTGASTLQINALGVKPLVDTDLNPLVADDIEDNSIYLISYNFAVDSYQVMGLAKTTANPMVYVNLFTDLDSLPTAQKNEGYLYCTKFNTQGQNINLLYRYISLTDSFVEVAPNITVLNLQADNVLHIATYNGIGTQVMVHGVLTNARVCAYDFVRDIQGGVGQVTYGIRKSGMGSGFPTLNNLTEGFSTNPKEAIIQFDCSELGTQQVEVWVKDTVNLVGVYSLTFVQIQDNEALC